MQKTEPALSTNDLLARVKADLQSLVLWAEGDAACSRDSEAPEQARNDERRAKALLKALDIISTCTR